ncbi:MAG TPA: alpha/beta hydrolase [Streptosporangiaceae bacterium]|nr:alpha/beta hydrolase [Streptosporangiaceae bacterium]
MAQVVIAADGRRLSVETLGAPEGKPVFLFHGTPGARNGPRPRGIVLYRLGIKLICHDRPGYGDSDRQHGRTVGHIASDIAEIADSLGIDTFSVVGRSGGGPHALACAALLRGRVECAAALGSLAPIDAEGLDWWDGMVESNVRAYRTGEDQLELMADAMAAELRNDPESLLRSLGSELDADDREVVEDIGLRRIIAETHAKALQKSATGWIDDVVALRSPWGFDVSSIKIPVMLWHGTDDVFSPINHTYWLAKRIHQSVLEERSETAHFASVRILPEVLRWIVCTVSGKSRSQPMGAISV